MNLKHDDPTVSIPEFLQIEKKCYDKILGLLNEQMLAIEQEDEKKLDAVIDEKDSILQTARENESHLETAVAQLSRKELTEIGKQTEELKMDIESVLAQIIAKENDCQTELKARKFIAQDKILDLKQKRGLLKGYGTSGRIKPKISKSV